MAAEKAEICMTTVLTKKFDFTKSDPIFKVAMVSLAALGTEVRTIGGETMRAVQCMGFTTLLGCVFAACCDEKSVAKSKKVNNSQKGGQ